MKRLLALSSERKIVAGITLITALVLACGDGDSATAPEAQTETQTMVGPTIVGCNSVRYEGHTFNNIGCAPGIASFDVEISETVGGETFAASFHITCASGFVSGVTVT